MRERDIENYLRDKLREAGGIAFKFTSPARRGVPDRLCLFPSGRMMFVELKAPGAKPTTLQQREHQRIRDLGQRVDVIDSKQQVLELIKESQQWPAI